MPTPEITQPTTDLPKAYVAAEHERDLYAMWESSGVFTPHTDTSKPAFTTIMPPPNANGNLHMGHALDIALKDALVRYHRMRGDRTLWVPGSDHAGIETQVVFEKKLEKEGRSRFQMTREQFYDEVNTFTQENKGNMESQVRMLGASCDWTTERFTLDPEIVTQVYATFKKLYEDGLIYRGERIVNFSVKYQTAYSDLEVVHEERQDPLYYLKYGPLTVATVRPETTFGDVAVAVHPDDARYKRYVGTMISVTLATGEVKEMPVIADTFVTPTFGTGAVKVTPAHDPNDFEMAQRHSLPLIPTINTQGRLTDVAGEFAGMKVAEAREKVVAKLTEMGLVERVDPTYRHSVGLCYKSMQPIEPLVMPQWYIKVRPLADRAIQAIEAGEVEFFPRGMKKVELDWLKNLRDWNISRQVWWGIPIKDALPSEPAVANDPDTFDTWFSSGQWPYLVLQALGKRDGRDWLSEFYPTTLMETGRDLIFLWVPRMLMFGLYTQGKVPFEKVYFHGMVLDRHGKKMSKSKGNVVSPVEMVAKYGADAVRFGLVVGSAAGADFPLPEEKMVGGRNFANKVWNIARFIDIQLDGRPLASTPASAVTAADTEILAALATTVREVTEHLEKYRFAQALQTVHDFLWHQFADVYLEAAKTQGSNGRIDDATAAILGSVLLTGLRLLHPFMPFVTEAIYQKLPGHQGMLVTQPWPTA